MTSRLGWFFIGILTGILFSVTYFFIKWHFYFKEVWYVYVIYLVCVFVIKLTSWEESITGAGE